MINKVKIVSEYRSKHTQIGKEAEKISGTNLLDNNDVYIKKSLWMESWLKERRLLDVILGEQILYFVGPNDTVEDVWKILCSAGIYCVPVIEDGKALGLIDWNDVVCGLCEALDEADIESLINSRDLVDPKKLVQKYFSLKAVSIINKSERNEYKPIQANSTLYDGMQCLISGTKRLPVVDENDKIVAIVSPSIIVKYLTHFLNEECFQKLKETKISEVSIKSVTSIDCDVVLLVALQSLNNSGAASLAILEEGDLISTFSLKDLRGIACIDDFDKLFTTVGEYITEIRRKSPKARFPAIHCFIESPIESAMLRLSATGIHRLFVIENSGDSKKPVGVISLRDILVAVMKS